MNLQKLIKGNSLITGISSTVAFTDMEVLCHVISSNNNTILAKYTNVVKEGYELFYRIEEKEIWLSAEPDKFATAKEGEIISIEWRITDNDDNVYGFDKPMRIFSEQTTF